ncbi:N(2)-acetyl-L-2,4-diaminobutanoate deacetylase DoeB [Oricola cellulosilytica]|uniref:N-alpha-acetyl diaminobutyric acid deacetylase DoeB n=1 Tax=Oricola cellulosilytica TaxID=1429082 RepID=A0A4R0PIC4_9HYPH|nr:N(2)-acetyl-L-2,4-diaminobutanoate deacetylase DoeB [Oricola cellulosilytica]TCD16523.1 N-alpha-acetyl diaminobutyric acid deacetylase DoeB [Oricola cellulosilytica]
MVTNPIQPTIPLDAEGVHHGHLRLPYSRDDSAWGSVMIPIAVVANGKGPTALLTGGNHGDEYEGPIALQNLAASLKPDEISGRVIIVPAFNYPAFRAGTRTSPIDKGNLNRSFPGRPDGTVTEKIADYFNTVLVPEADIVLDFHSGGRTLDFLPFAAAHILDDAAQQAACVAAMRAFNAPWSMMMREIDSAGMYDGAVEAQGKVFVTTELGGGGTATARSVAIARKGVRNLLIHAGILKGEPVVEESTDLVMPDDDCFVFCEADGMAEPCADLGDRIGKGDCLVRVWPLDRTGVPPVEYRARRSGILAARHFPGLVQAGDCLAVVAETVS